MYIPDEFVLLLTPGGAAGNNNDGGFLFFCRIHTFRIWYRTAARFYWRQGKLPCHMETREGSHDAV